MSDRTTFIRTIKDALSNLDIANLQDFKNIIAQINTLSDDEIQAIYQDIGGVAAESQIGLVAIDRLPYPVAILLQETNKQRNDLVRLLFLMESVECLVRWRLGQSLSLIHAERNWTIPDGLLGDFSKKILKPSMGIWIGGFERIAKQIQQNEQLWGVDIVNLLTDIELLNLIVQIRNNIAHGDIMGDATAYLNDAKGYAEDLFNRYAALEIEHFVVASGQTYRADGPQLATHSSPVTLSAPENKKLDQSADFYCFTKNDQPILQHPVIFRIFSDAPTMEGLTHNFSTGSFISTHKDCRTIKSGGTLVYSLVDGKSTPEISDLSDFVQLFKTNIKVMANLPWKGLFEELNGYAAWKVDRKLIKHCRQEYSCLANTGYHAELKEVSPPDADDFPQAKMWYFGGGPEMGKSTLLLSYLETTSASGALVFPYRFQDNDDENAALDGFLRSLRDALVYWLRQYDEVSIPDTSLKGDDLFKDVDVLLQRLCAANPSIELILGLDDLHHLYILEDLEQPVLIRLLGYIEQWGRFTHAKIRTSFDRKTRTQTFDNQCHRQVFVLATGMDQGDERQDIDNFLAKDTRVAFIYTPSHIESLEPKSKSDSLPPHASSRNRELHAHTCQPTGAHMPPVQTYGAIDIMRESQRNTKFGKHMKPQGPGHQFIADTLNVAQGNPLIIDAIAENLHSGNINIDDPVTHDSYTLATAKSSPYLENTSYIVPTILCFMQTLKVPLTIESLQILCSNSTTPNPEEHTWISQALYTIPQYIEKVSLSESNDDGTLAIGWQLRPTNPPKLLTNLGLVQTLTDGRIQYLVDNIQSLSDSLQLKAVLRQHAGISAQPSGNTVQDIFAALRGALTEGVLDALTQFSDEPVLQSNADMLYQTAAIAPASITWLQKTSESAALSKQAEAYTQSKSFYDIWLKHVNAERTPIFEHEIANIGYVEKLERTIPINDDFYIVMGAADKKGLHQSIAIYHHQRTQPDLVLLSLDSPEKATDCIVISNETNIARVAVAIGEQVQIHSIELSDEATSTHPPYIHDYRDEITGLLALNTSDLAVYGKRIETDANKKKGWAVDVLSNLFGSAVTDTTHLVGEKPTSSNAPKYGFHIGSQACITYGKTVVEVNLDGVSEQFALDPNPQETPRTFSTGMLYQRKKTKKKKSEMTTSWYSTTHHASKPLHTLDGSDEFPQINFAQPLSEDRLLTVDYHGVLRIYAWEEAVPLCEIDLKVPEEIKRPRMAGVIGGLLNDTRLLIYGARSFMTFYDIADILQDPVNNTTINQEIALSLHFGTVKGAQPVDMTFAQHNDLVITWSDDNDLRLWSWSKGSAQNPDDFCVGLFRGHSAKIKDIHVTSDNLVSIDERQNIRIWSFNDGAIEQLVRLAPQDPNYVKHSFMLNKTLWTVTSAGDLIHIESYQPHPTKGIDWSSRQASLKQRAKIHTANHIDKIMNLNQYIVLLPKSKAQRPIQVFDTRAQTFDQPIPDVLFTKSQQYDTGVLLYNSKELYNLDASLNYQKYPITLQDTEELILARACNEGVHYVVKDLDSDDQHIFVMDLDGSGIQHVTTIVSTAAINGLYYKDDILICWVKRDKEPIDIHWYNLKTKQLLLAPTHALLKSGLQFIYPLPNAQGFSFRSGDNSRRWTLRFDYPIIQDDTMPHQKTLLLNVHTDWEYADNHLPEMLDGYADKAFTLNGVIAESTVFGVVVNYQHSNGARRLLWTGDSIRDYKVIDITDDGRILLQKNRSIIALQLMRGSEAIGFNTIVTN